MGRSTRKEPPQVMIAGPGAGKTYNMVSKISECVPHLHSNRFLAAITYTNAAADVIRSRLYRTCRPSRNIYIGTIHSFFNRFILSPFASVLGELPDDPIFMAVDPSSLDKRSGKKLTGRSRSIARNRMFAAMIKKGVVPYDQMSGLAATLIEQKSVRRLVGYRLQFVFVDEFQDVDTTQYRVFESLRKEGKSNIYVVGDPEQYISSFTYRVRSVNAPKFENIPFFRFAEKGNCDNLPDNHRSCSEIVQFTNQFHSHLDQDAIKGSRKNPRVHFISETSLSAVVERFQNVSDEQHLGDDPIERLYLGLANSTFDECKEQFGLVPVSNSGVVEKSLLADTLDVICAVFEMSRRKLKREFDLSEIELRKHGISVLRKIREGEIGGMSELRDWLREMFPESSIDDSKSSGETETKMLVDAVVHNTERPATERVASIHKSKGLEADGVLVVAKSCAELRKWCETDHDERQLHKDDACRLGFVAFTRAKETLCIACKKAIDDDTRKLLKSLGVTFV